MRDPQRSRKLHSFVFYEVWSSSPGGLHPLQLFGGHKKESWTEDTAMHWLRPDSAEGAHLSCEALQLSS